MKITPEILHVCLKHQHTIFKYKRGGQLRPGYLCYDREANDFSRDFSEVVYMFAGESTVCASQCIEPDKDCGGWDCWVCAMKVGYDIIKKYGGVEYA